MRVIKWYSEQEQKKDWLRIYVREHNKNYGPIFLSAKKIYTTRTASREAALPNLIELLAEVGDAEKARTLYDELGIKSKKLEEKIIRAKQQPNIESKIEIEEKIIANKSTFFLKTFDNLEFKIGRKMMINKEPVSTTNHYRNTFDDSANYIMPEHWKPLLEKQRTIHQNLRKLGETLFFPFAIRRRDAEEKYALRVIELQKEIETSLDWSLIGIPGELRHEYAMNYTLILFSQIKTGNINKNILPSSLAYSAGPWSEELKKINAEEYRKIIEAKKLFRNYLKIIEENFEHDATIIPEPPYKLYWEKVEKYAEKNKISVEEAAIITGDPDLISLYKETINLFYELKNEVKKLGGDASINPEMMRCKIFLEDEIENLESSNQSNQEPEESKASIDTEAVGYKGSKKEPEGKNPRTIVSTIVGDHFKKAYSYLKVPELMQSPYTGEVFKVENIPDYNLLLRRASKDYIDLSAVFGYNLESYDISAQSNSRRNTKKKDTLYLDNKMKKIMEKPQNIFIPNVDNTEAEFKSATFLKHFTINTQIIDLLKIARNHYGFLTVNSKLMTFKNLIKHFNPELPFEFEKHAGSYAEAERWFYEGRGEDLALYGYTDTEATHHIAEYFWPVLKELEKNLKINMERLLRSKMDVAVEYWAKKWYEKGIDRQVFETVSSTMFKSKQNKNTLLRQEGLEPKLLGEFEGHAYINPLILNSGKKIIESREELKLLNNSMTKEKDFILKYLRFSFLESIIGSALADMTLTRHGRIEPKFFKEIYLVEADELFETMNEETQKAAKIMINNNYLTFTGDMSFYSKKSEELEKNGFIYISPVKVLQKDKQDLAIKFIGKKSNYVGSTNIKLPSQREAYGEDYINKGFAPNFQTKLIYEFVKMDDWKQRLILVGETAKKIRNGSLNQKEYLMTIKPDHHLVNNAQQFYDTKRGIIILKNGIRRDVEYTFIVEGYRNNQVVKENWLESDNIVFTEYLEKMTFYPHRPFYLAMLWEPERIFNKLFYNSLIPTFPEENRKKAKAILKELETGNYTNETIKKLEFLKQQEKQLELF